MTDTNPDAPLAGMRSTIAILESLRANDMAAATRHVAECDPRMTIIGLATAWESLATHFHADTALLIQGMRDELADREARR